MSTRAGICRTVVTIKVHFVYRTDFDHAPDPASALAAIEAETGDVNAGSSKDALKHLRHLLEREIEAQVRGLCNCSPAVFLTLQLAVLGQMQNCSMFT